MTSVSRWRRSAWAFPGSPRVSSASRKNRDAIRRVDPQPTTRQSLSITTRIESVLPPASELERYEALQPGVTGRFVATFEKQVDHRIALETRVVRWDLVRSMAGLILGFIVAMTIVIGSFILILNGHSDQGAAGIIATLVSIIGIFVYSDITRRRERKSKS